MISKVILILALTPFINEQYAELGHYSGDFSESEIQPVDNTVHHTVENICSDVNGSGSDGNGNDQGNGDLIRFSDEPVNVAAPSGWYAPDEDDRWLGEALDELVVDRKNVEEQRLAAAWDPGYTQLLVDCAEQVEVNSNLQSPGGRTTTDSQDPEFIRLAVERADEIDRTLAQRNLLDDSQDLLLLNAVVAVDPPINAESVTASQLPGHRDIDVGSFNSLIDDMDLEKGLSLSQMLNFIDGNDNDAFGSLLADDADDDEIPSEEDVVMDVFDYTPITTTVSYFFFIYLFIRRKKPRISHFRF